MGPSDVIAAIAVLGGAAYLLYRSVWTKKGHCPGCPGGCPDKLTAIGRRPDPRGGPAP